MLAGFAMIRLAVSALALSTLFAVPNDLRLVAAGPELRAGVVASTGAESVLAIPGEALLRGTRLTLITPAPPQTTRFAEVRAEAPNDGDDMSERTPGPYYELVSADGNRPLPPFAVAVLGDSTVSRIGDAVSLRMSADLPDVRARWCASYEGIHFTLWAGEPIKSRRIWHVYYSAGANLRPTCDAAETRDDGGAVSGDQTELFAFLHRLRPPARAEFVEHAAAVRLDGVFAHK